MYVVCWYDRNGTYDRKAFPSAGRAVAFVINRYLARCKWCAAFDLSDRVLAQFGDVSHPFLQS